ncbi:type III pantothenate kinase [Sporolactobacillus sp. Y61]|jgi:type III pantothenate kinase|uniref:Type III pantothenate kinase n=1 Tax=Sporolactobacillus sp. Y61 TaxID=3160863 RepID=A0AAU8IHB2_9BACL|nr:type III pantothenate kinase [Sporolactobacillus sp. THM19-2]RYL89839.1 type III pantothenate kinase [Sporolactobacillus sp. THM19-2]
MLFVCDVGNTNIVMGAFNEGELINHWRISTHTEKTEDEFAMLINNMLQYSGLSFQDFDGVAVSTVVPSVLFALERLCEKYFHLTPLIVGPGIKTGLNLKYENPREIGADLIVNAVAAVHDYQAPMIVIDFGTATTYSYIDEHANYIGGAIAPGINISTEALYQKASKLPRIEIAKPPHIVGRNTVHAMQSGVLFGYVGQVEGIVSRMKMQAKKKPVVIATGGLCTLISGETKVIDHVDKLLTLRGLNFIYQRNRQMERGS